MKQCTVRDNMNAAASNEVVPWNRSSNGTVPTADVERVAQFAEKSLDCYRKNAQIEIDRKDKTHRFELIALQARSTQKISEINNSLVMTQSELANATEKIAGLTKSNLDGGTQLEEAQRCLQSAHEKLNKSNCCCWVWFMIAVVLLLFVVFMVSVTCYTDHHNSQFVANAEERKKLTQEMLQHLPKASETEFKEKIENLHIDTDFTTVCPQPVMSMFLQLKNSWDEL